MNIGKRIRTYRKNIPLTMKELASSIGVSEQAVSQYELGKRIPSMEILLKIAKVFNLTYTELIKGTDIEFDDILVNLDITREAIEAKQKKSKSEYKKLYNSIEKLLKNYDYIFESDEQCNAIDEELITISKDDEEILSIRKSTLLSSGEEILNLIEQFKKFAVLGLIEKLRNNNA